MHLQGSATSTRLAIDFERLRNASRRDSYPSFDVRADRLKRLLGLVQDHQSEFQHAINADFGHRAAQETLLTELLPVESALRHAIRHLASWMKQKRVPTSRMFWPGRNRLLPQPLGVAGIISPWNCPLQLTLAPAVGAIAAGNRIMMKPSELVPVFSALLQKLVGERFGADEMVVVTGDVEVSRAFSQLPFDHLLFTGSTAVGRMVAEAAARNLTPVTLELGGKSPALIDASADVAEAAGRIAYAKMLNAGQTCIAPDYVVCAPDQVSAFVHAYKAEVARMLGRDPATPDYTAIISDRHFQRLEAIVGDALSKGASVEDCVTNDPAWKAARKFPPCLVTHTNSDMTLRSEEIFGPVLPILTAGTVDEAIALVNAGDRPLALYWFGTHRSSLKRILRETVSGGVTVNDCILHQVQEAQPFGGVGASGMGAYHGEWGFRTFSKEKPIFYRPRLSGIAYLRPPYGRTFDTMIAMLRRLG